MRVEILINMDWQTSVDYYEKLIALFPEVERKGKSMPYTSLNGHMYSFIDKEGCMGLRLSADGLEKFMTTNKSHQMEQHGRLMKEYAVVPDSLLKNPKKLKKYFLESLAYVSSLKPKPTKKKG